LNSPNRVALCLTVSVEVLVRSPHEEHHRRRARGDLPCGEDYAAERDSSVSALVAEFLRSLSQREVEFSRLEAQQKRVWAGIDRFRARDRLDRDEIHDRAVR
jgi:hypothetical protein